MAVINTNTKALFSQLALQGSGRVMAKAMEQLSTGKRINSGGDDAAGLAIATRMTQQIRSLNQAVRNAGDAVSLMQTTEGATNEITNMLQRMRELSIQAINDTNSNEDRSYLDLEFQQLKQEIERVSGTTEWNGFKVLDGTAGERVGEMPVYKATSVALSGDLLINPTTLRTVAGADAGEQQTVRFLSDMKPSVVRAVEVQRVTFGAADADGSLTLGGVSVAVEASDTIEIVGAKVASAMNNSFFVGERQDITFSAANAGGAFTVGGVAVTVDPAATTADDVAVAARDALLAAQAAGTAFLNANITQDGAILSIEFPAAAGNPDNVAVLPAATGVTATIAVSREFGDRKVVDNKNGTLDVTFAPSDNDAVLLVFNDVGTTGVTATRIELAQGIPKTNEVFGAGSRYIQAGALALDLATTAVDGEVVATFTTADGVALEIKGTLTTATGTVTFSDALGENAKVLSGSVTYAFRNATAALTLAAGAGNGLPLSLSVQVADLPKTGQIKVGGVNIQIREGDALNSTVFTSRIKAELERSSMFADGTGRSIAQAGNELTITFAPTDGDVDDIEIVPGGTGVNPAVTQTRPAIVLAQETVSSGGKFKQSGSLSLQVSANGVVTASFLTNAGETIRLTAELTAATGKVVFRELDADGLPVGLNSQAVSGTVTYTLMNSASDGLSVVGRAVDLTVDIEGGISAMRAGDLRINGVEIGASHPADDGLSPQNNAAGSAIAKAAAINRKAGATGSTVGESQSITFAGVPKPGKLTVAGVTVLVSENDNTVARVASKVASALRTHPDFDVTSGRVVSYATGSTVIHIDFPASERDVPKTEVLPGTTNLSAVVDVTREFATSVPGTGVFAKVNENVVLGQEMSADSVVRGVVFINGFASADITTTLNNTRESRKTVVDAINAISRRTGVKAIDTGSDPQGVTLIAADGRNIEVRFETPANDTLFGRRIGLRQGVQASTLSLESKVNAPIILSSSSTGDIGRVGLLEGNFSRNESVVNTAQREAVSSPVAQAQRVLIEGDSGIGDVFSMTINGKTFSHTVVAGKISNQDVRDGLLAAVSGAQAGLLGVKLSGGLVVGELIVTAVTPGDPYTLSISKSSGATATIAVGTIDENQPSQARSLGLNDLVINGVEIRPSVAGDDKSSSITSLSSNRAASAVAIAAAINHHSSETGVRALANTVVSKGGQTSTLVPDTGTYLLFINGTKVDVPFVKAETPAARRESVIAAINERTGQHGVTAGDNGRGITLMSDGRNLSVWFDGNVENLSAASFGLDKGGSIAQVSRIAIAGTVATQTATIELNGVSIVSLAAEAPPSAANLASKVAAAIRAKITADELLPNRQLANLEVVHKDGDAFVEIVSKIAGTAFDLRGASVSGAGPTLNLSTVTPNSLGLNDVSVIRGATAQTNTARTLYGTVRLISDPKLLPEIPSPLGSPPSDQLSKINATGKPIDIRVGDRGFSSSGNFVGLGFQQGLFGGRASEALDPPRVGRLAFQVGASANQLITIDLADFGKGGAITSSITGDVDLFVEDRTNRIHTRDGATAVLEKLDDVMNNINATRAQMGAVMNRLQYAMDNLTNVSMNQEASRSQIQDADYAKASTELAKSQIMQQAATAVLAQANMSQQTVLQLLQG